MDKPNQNPTPSESDYEREKREDMERWQRYELTGEAIPHEKVMAWLEELAKL